MKLSKSASGILSARYRIVLIKCFLANLILLPLPVSAGTTVPDGIYTNKSFSDTEELFINSGTFTEVDFSAPSITITGGTFRNIIDVMGDNITLTGGSFYDSLWLGGKNISIDSDKASLNLTPPTERPGIDADDLVITGTRGISVTNTTVSSLRTSGKITASGDSLAGNFTETGHSIYTINGKTVHSSDSGINYIPALSDKKDTSFSNATITLNGNSTAGSGYYMYSGGIDANGNWDDDAIDTDALLRDKLTASEIDTSVAVFMADLKSSKSYDDLMDITRSSFGTIIDSSTDWSVLDYNKIESDLRQKYADFNTMLGETGAAVNISASTFVLNDNAKLINDSFKSGDMTITASTVTVNGSNELSARSGKVQFVGSVLDVADNAVLTFSSADGALHLDGGSTLSLSGKMTGGVAAENGATIAIQSSAARLNGTLSGSADVNFNADYALSNLSLADDFQFRNIFIDSGKMLDIGTNRLIASSISGGTISAVLTDAAGTTPIITADAKNVTIKLGMSAASNTKTTRYHITQGTGFKLSDYSTTRYAVSSTYFAPADAAKVGALTNWNGGDLYILRLSGSAAPIIDDLENNGVKVDPVFEKAAQILDLDDKYLEKLTDKQLDALDTVDDLLTEFDGDSKNTHQILREVAPDLSHSDMRSAEANALNLLNIVGLRFSTPAAAQRRGYNGGYYNRYYGYGRSGGDYAVGEGSLWAQGMINRVKSTAEQPFTANSGGFAAGVEVNAAEYFKFGFGYAYTDTNIKSERSKNNVETHSGFVYGHLQPQRAYFNFIAAFGHSRYKDTTKLAQLKSYYYADSVSAQIALGYASLLTPEIGLRYMNVHQSTFEDALGAKSKAKDVSTLTGTGGLKLSHRYRLRANPQTAFIPELKAAATYDLARNRNDVAVLLPNGAAYTVKGESLKRFGVEAGAGLTISFGNDAELSLSYDGKFKPDYQDHTGMVNLKVKF